MASDLSVSNLDFGVVIAFVAPGFVTFQAVSYHMPTARAWMDAATNREQSVGVFLFVLLASLAIGVVVSGVRALVIDRFLTAPFLGKLAVPPLRLDWSRVDVGKLPVLLTIRDNYYRYYQFYANTFVALVLWAWSRSLAAGLGLNWYQWGILAAMFVALLESARGSWRRYVEAVGQAF